ncbi:MAG TPA: DUF4286 family protein [Rhodanobacteraceae bacterium]|jgi:hypothetical protein|nr:DUF4286 family protein [Rhodanobacteraceae bacterium]
MILYVVDLEMSAALHDEYMAWLQDHVREMLALPGFEGAEIMSRIEPPPSEDHWTICVHYRLRDRAAWQAYLSGHAPRMRRAGSDRFGGRVKTTRRVLEIA